MNLVNNLIAAVCGLSVLNGLIYADSNTKSCVEYGEKLFTDQSEDVVTKVNTYCRPLAEADDPVAQYYLASVFMFPTNNKEPDTESADKWMSRSAENGYGRAQFYMASIYKYRSEEDVEKAIYWYTKAAESGVVPAPLELADMYHHGVGTNIDGRKAIYWYEYAVDKYQLRNAIEALIEIYSEGIPGVEKDTSKVEFWKKRLDSSDCPNKAAQQGRAEKQRAC